MPGKILGLDISEDSITAVQVESGLKGYRVTACNRVAVASEEGLDEALKGLFEGVDLESDTCNASIPADQVSFRNIQMPFKEPKKVRQTLAFEIETMVPFPIQDLVVDFLFVNRAEKSDILAASVKKAHVSSCLERLAPLGIDPDVLDIRCVSLVSWLMRQEGVPENGLFLDMGEKRITMVLYVNKRIALIRSLAIDGDPIARAVFPAEEDSAVDRSEQIRACFESFCRTVQGTIHAFASESGITGPPERVFFAGMGALYPHTHDLLSQYLDIPASVVRINGDKGVRMEGGPAQNWRPELMGNALALALRDAKKGQGFNFRRDEFEIKTHYLGFQRELRKAAAFVIIILALVAADFGVDRYLLQKRYTMLDHRIHEVFREVFPQARIVEPLHQMKVKIAELKESDVSNPAISANQTVLDLMRDISERIPDSLDVHMSRMVIDGETVRMSGDTDNFNAVDSIKGGLEPSDYFSQVTISSANLERGGKRVKFELKLERSTQ